MKDQRPVCSWFMGLCQQLPSNPMRASFIGRFLALLIAVGGLASCSTSSDHQKIAAFRSVFGQGNALEAKILLTELREGRLTNALELLEQKLDTSVIVLNKRLSKADEIEKQSILQVLRILKEYRQSHPRVREADILGEDAQAMAETNRMIGETVDRILEETK